MMLDDVFMGGRDIGIFFIVMFLMVSFMGVIIVLGIFIEMYNNNISYWFVGMVMLIIVLLINYIFFLFFYDLFLMFVYEVS